MDQELSRRDVLAGMGVVGLLGMLSAPGETELLASDPKSGTSGSYMHKLPPLPYPEDALEPVIDKQTVQIHHGKHFAGYVDGLNATLQKIEEARKTGKFDAIKALSRDLAFNGSGAVLHHIYFATIGPKAGGVPEGKIGDRIKKDFGSFDAFWAQFSAASKTVEASGWGVLAWEPFSGCLVIMQAEKHQNLASWGAMPLMVCDVWEHAYYLRYQNRRAEYVDKFKNIIDWKKVDGLFQKFCNTK
jgi:superoxide dismutase, Fe-Mn family